MTFVVAQTVPPSRPRPRCAARRWQPGFENRRDPHGRIRAGNTPLGEYETVLDPLRTGWVRVGSGAELGSFGHPEGVPWTSISLPRSALSSPSWRASSKPNAPPPSWILRRNSCRRPSTRRPSACSCANSPLAAGSECRGRRSTAASSDPGSTTSCSRKRSRAMARRSRARASASSARRSSATATSS